MLDPDLFTNKAADAQLKVAQHRVKIFERLYGKLTLEEVQTRLHDTKAIFDSLSSFETKKREQYHRQVKDMRGYASALTVLNNFNTQQP